MAIAVKVADSTGPGGIGQWSAASGIGGPTAITVEVVEIDTTVLPVVVVP